MECDLHENNMPEMHGGIGMIELARYGVYRIRKYEGATMPYDVEE